MSYRTHATHAKQVAVQFDTLENCAETFGWADAPDNPEEKALILNDMDNMEAFVIQGSVQDWRYIAELILANLRDA